MRYKVGDIVRISKKDSYYGNIHHTKDMDGKVTRVSSNMTFVRWGDGRDAGYFERRLKLRSRAS